MKSKYMAYFFLYLFTFNYVLGIVAAAYGQTRERRSAGCRLTPQCQVKLETCLLQIRNDMPDDLDVPDQKVAEYELTQGTASGFKNFAWESFQCACGRNFVRIFVRVNFLRILLTFVMNLLDDVLGGLLGALGSGLSRLLGNVVNLVVRILCLEIIVEITILQRFIPGTKCIIESYKVSRVTTIKLLGLDLAPLVEVLSPLLTPVVDLLLQIIFNTKIKEAFQREIGKLEIIRSDVICY